MRSMFVSVLASSTAIVALLMACTTTTTTVVDGSDASTASGDGGKKDGSSTPIGEEDAGETVSGDDACGAEATLSACGTCCGNGHKTGATNSLQMILACACAGTGAKDAGAAGPCATACAATFCASTPKNPDAACNTCIQNSLKQGGACFDGVNAACGADKECVAYNTCLNDQCASKQ